jgi:5-methylcytosine-specific restriction endonuclease McrA
MKRQKKKADPFYSSPEWLAIRAQVLRRDNYQCQLKGSRCLGKASCVDHWVPRSKGGSNALSNLRASCLPCNTQKKDKMPTPLVSVNW